MAHDLFVSYAEADRAWVEGYLLDALEQAGVRYHSQDAFLLGAPRLIEFERAVRDSRRTLLILSPAYLTSRFNEFVDLLAQTYGIETATWPVIPLILQPLKLPPRLAMLQSLDATEPAKWAKVLARLCADLQRPIPPPPPPPACPYPGMAPFRERDSARFFGREHEIRDVVSRLRAHPILTVIGPSGSGKSSLVLAGVLPALRRSGLFGPGEWIVRTLRPGEQPLDTLARTLEDLPRMQQVGTLASALALGNAMRLLLVVDQFEETFTLAGVHSLPFQRELLRLAQSAGCYVILTVRADFYPDLMNAPIWRSIQSHRFEVVPLDEDGLKAAIVRPAEDVGVFVESTLVERLVADGASEPGVLPLIQETLVLLWERLERRFLPMRAYDALVLSRGTYGTSVGGRTGLQVAIARRAEVALAELAPEQQAIARRIFLRLIQFGEGRADTRRQQPVSALRSAARAEPLLFDATLGHLTDARLLTLSGEERDADRKVDIAHEALITGWPALYGWLNERREVELTRRRLDDKAQEWVRLGGGDGGLLDAIELAEAERWLESPAADDAGYDPALPELVVFSRAAIEQAEYEKELVRQRELAQAQALAEEQRGRAEEQARAIASFRRLIAVLVLVLLLAVGAAAYAYTQQILAAANEAKALTNADRAATNAANAQLNASTAVAEKQRADANAQLEARAKGQAQTNFQLAAANAQTAQANAGTAVAFQGLANQRAQEAQANADQAAANAQTAQANAAAEKRAKGEAQTNFQLAEGNAATAKANAQRADASAATSQANANLADSRLGEARTAQANAIGQAALAQTAQADAQANAAAANAARADAERNAQQARAAAAAEAAAKIEAQTAQANAQRQAQTAVAAKIDAENQAKVAFSRQLAAQSLYYQDKQLDLALLLGVEASRVADTFESRNSLLSALAYSSHLTGVIHAAEGELADIALTSDGRTLATVECTQRVQLLCVHSDISLWDTGNHKQIGTLSADGMDFQRLAFSPSGKLLAAGGCQIPPNNVSQSCEQGVVGLWDLASKQPVATIPGNGYQIKDLAFNTSGTLLAANDYAAITFWNIANPATPVQSGQASLGTNGSINSIAFRPNPQGGPEIIAAGVCDEIEQGFGTCIKGAIRFWSAPDGQSTDTLTGPYTGSPFTTFVASVAFDPTGKLVASSIGGTIDFWNADTHQFIAAVYNDSSSQAFDGLVFSPDGRLLASASDDNTIRIWKMPAQYSSYVPAATEPFMLGANAISGLAFGPDSKMLVSGSSDGTVGLWNVVEHAVTGAPVQQFNQPVASVAFSPDGALLAAAVGTSIKLWDGPASSNWITSTNYISRIAFSPTKRLLAVVGGNLLQLWDTANPSQPRLLSSTTEPTGSLLSISFRNDGQMLATSSATIIRYWDIANPSQPREVGHSQVGGLGGGESIAFSPDGTVLAGGVCTDQYNGEFNAICIRAEIHLWSVPSGRDLGVRLKEYTSSVGNILFSADGKLLASVSGNELKVWNITSLQAPTLRFGLNAKSTFLGGSQDNGLALNSDASILAWSNSQAINLLSIPNKQQLGRPFTGHTDSITSLALSPDGKLLVSGSRDGAVRITDLTVDAWRARACAIAYRNLTTDEWAQFFGAAHITRPARIFRKIHSE